MEPPYHEMSPMRVLLKIQKSDPPKLDRPSKWSKEFNEFLKISLTKDPNQRPRAEELLRVSSLSIETVSSASFKTCLFQHPFVRDATDPKPILELLAEYKAEIVEEEITDIPEDADVSRDEIVVCFPS